MDFFRPYAYLDIPTKDILSYVFDEPQYDQNMPIYIDAADTERTISCNQARRMVRMLIAGLRAGGVKKGDCVNIHSFNEIHYPLLVLAIIGLGAIFTGSNPSYTSIELTHYLKTSEATFIISEPEILDSIMQAAGNCNIPESNVWVFDNSPHQQVPHGLRSWKKLLAVGEEDWVRFDDLDTCQNTTAARMFSSGTTGLPKAVIMSHRNLIAQHVVAFEANRPNYQIVEIAALPTFHAAVIPTIIVTALKSPHITYVMRRFELDTFLTTVYERGVTEITTVPPTVVSMLKSPLAQRGYLKNVRSGIVGGAPLENTLQQQFRALMAPSATYNGSFGMTETTCRAIFVPPSEQDSTGSVGRPVANLEVKLIDENGRNISGYDVRGEICVRGPTVVKGYFRNPKADAESRDEDGFFKSGDIGYCDGKTNKWYIVDRKKELIKVRGFQVAPAELEAVLLDHPSVQDAAVIGVAFPDGRKADEQGTEYPRAYVVLANGKDGVTESELKAFVAARLARYKALTGGVRFVDSIPKNPSGKILKKTLREMVRRESEGLSRNAKL